MPIYMNLNQIGSVLQSIQCIQSKLYAKNTEPHPHAFKSILYAASFKLCANVAGYSKISIIGL